ncbi:MAG: bifunctional demethylmenaquinone methyltransferase/2-methoxy-6-polyprenyl-1,4-benzoquinol methylase UbiE [candidate division Zixibacteria bacterium]|nr:bifunctional demethylmenaquinone methyltransferase/2-methoxy-6-polyprenyl-1,4-benzoquinol methylase UbiE [candidate division Zixibacteria bacterium]
MTETAHSRTIRTMFDRISPRYDLLNRVLSLGLDLRWRNRAVTMLADLRGQTALDLCCGSGDCIAILLKKYRNDIAVIGVDFARGMLDIARRRFVAADSSRIILCQADALALPCRDASIDAVTIGFGIRNIEDKPAALKEIHRVLRPGGRLAIIEPSVPKNRFWRGLFSFYFGKVMPFVGGVISGDRGAYQYLHDSVAAFPDPDEFVALMRSAGFVNATAIPQTPSTAMIYFAEKA